LPAARPSHVVQLVEAVALIDGSNEALVGRVHHAVSTPAGEPHDDAVERLVAADDSQLGIGELHDNRRKRSCASHRTIISLASGAGIGRSIVNGGYPWREIL